MTRIFPKVFLLVMALGLGSPAAGGQQKPLVMKAGQLQQIQPGDTLDASQAVNLPLASGVSGTLPTTNLPMGWASSTRLAGRVQGAVWSMPTDPQFGAKCDGSTDDTAAIQAWASSTVNGAHMRLPNSTCIIKSVITWPVVDNVTLEGAGSQSIIKYAGTSTTSSGFILGDGTHATPARWWKIRNLQFQTGSVMTGGTALTLNEFKMAEVENIIIGGDNPLVNWWYNGIAFRGGGSIHFRGASLAAQNDAEQISGGSTTDPLVDFYQLQAVILSSKVGLHLGGATGGVTIDQTDILENATNVLIDQGLVAAANGQTFFGADVALDETRNYAGDANIDVDLADSGGNLDNILQFNGTWIASAQYVSSTANSGVCLMVRAGVTWNIHFTGGTLTNCQTDAIRNASTSLHLDAFGTRIVHSGNYGINNISGGGYFSVGAVVWPYGTMVANGSGNVSNVPGSAVSCAAGSVSVSTIVVTNGIVTHC